MQQGRPMALASEAAAATSESNETSGAQADDDEFDQYRKRMMLAYRFRPNPLVRAAHRADELCGLMD